jgi:hypothetical protein
VANYARNVLGLGEKIADPINALDYPWALPDDSVVIWIAFSKWPEPGRWLRYISKTQRDPMKGFFLLTHSHRDAQRFGSTQEALQFLAAENVKRGPGMHWQGLQITNVALMKVRCGYYVETQ